MHRPSRGLVALTLPLILFLAVPVVGLVARAFLGGGLIAALANPVVLDALRLSLVTTAFVVLLVGGFVMAPIEAGELPAGSPVDVLRLG